MKIPFVSKCCRCYISLVVVLWMSLSDSHSWFLNVSARATWKDNDEGLESPQERRGEREQARVYRNRIVPNWVANNSKFWYRNDLPNGAKEFVVVDTQQGKRESAFDHSAIATAIGKETKATQLPIDSLEFDSSGTLTTLVMQNRKYAWDAITRKLTELAGVAADNSVSDTNALGRNSNRQASRTGAETSLTFVNRTQGPAEIFWISTDGTKQSYGNITPGTTRSQHTFGGHRWEVVNDRNESLGIIVADDSPKEIVIDGRRFESTLPTNQSQRRRPRDSSSKGPPSNRSSDGKWITAIEKHNVVIRSTENDERIELSNDGKEGLAYGQLQWAPDSKSLIAFRNQTVEIQQVHLLRSSPVKGGRAELESRPYALPGDAFPTYEPIIFQIEDRKQIKPKVDRFEHQWLRPRIRLSSDGNRFTYEQTDRGHGRFRLIEVEIASGQVRNIIDERSSTFIWTAHTENQTVSMVNWLTKSDEIVYATENKGWRQLILLDAKTGDVKRELTPSGIVVRGVNSIDEENRRIWLTACGREGQDPYLVHYAHVDLDDGKWTWLTQGDGNHSIEYSPDRQFIIDTFSRVDQAPVHELRRVSDGSLVCELERADISELKSSGWSAPEVFVAKGRDGETDIWGIISRPRNFDPSKRYPIVEDIYAGPQGSFVPKSFSPGSRDESLTSLGFIVVKIDGMGTANRSKAFHDVCWKNLKDGGFQDRILWMKAAATKYPELDLSRVGIYGTSAGGQNAAAAVLFHPEFYKVAVAACGCHDNRMDKASWNEQWMGYPVGTHYSECSNIDNAHRLQGKLLLIVGEMDNNVPPESTMRFADALVRANKDFDLLVIPNAGHGMGGAYGQKRMQDYFVRHMFGPGQPNLNSQSTSAGNESRQVNSPTIPALTPAAMALTSAQPAALTPAPTLAQAVAQGASSLERGLIPPASAFVRETLRVTPPPHEFFELVRERDRPLAREFYKKYLDVGGLPVVSAQAVADEALTRTYDIVTHILAGRPDILNAMKQNGMYLIIIGKDEVYTDMPEYRNHPNPEFQNERVRGTGGKPTSFGEENLLSLALDRYDDESIGVHEFCHTIDGALRSIDPTWSNRLRDVYNSARQNKLYERAYAGSSVGEYWAEICQAYFDCNRVNNWNHGPVGTREQLKAYDPVGYELVRSTFRLDQDQDWRYTFVRKLPVVEPPPAKLKLDPYYTKFTWAREFAVVGRQASDGAILRANDVVRKMFAYRHDILKSFIASGSKLVVLGRNERLSELPELRDVANLSKIDLLGRYLEYTPETKLLVVSEESLLSDPRVPGMGDFQLVQVLSKAIHQVAGQRPVDPDWENRPRNVWQQYELRLKRLDVQFDERLKSLFEKAKSAGKWQGTSGVHSHSAYWTAGVLAYFDAAGQTAPPTDSSRAIETREQLAAYDPELHALVNETMAFDQHVDWRLPMTR